jgi:hypothetical protein
MSCEKAEEFIKPYGTSKTSNFHQASSTTTRFALGNDANASERAEFSSKRSYDKWSHNHFVNG